MGINLPHKYYPSYIFQTIHSLIRLWFRSIRLNTFKYKGGLSKSKIELKLILAILPLALSVIFISVYAILNLKSVKRINNSIIENDMIHVEAANHMADHLLAQESSGRRYIILNSPYMLDLFWQHKKDFKDQFERIKKIPGPKNALTNKIELLYKKLEKLYMLEFRNLDHSNASFSKENDQKMKDLLSNLLSLIKKLEYHSQISQRKKIIKANEIGEKTYIITFALLYLGIFFVICVLFFIYRNILKTISHLKIATHDISRGDYNKITNSISRYDELSDLVKHFSYMTECLAMREKISLESSPLTGLPGGIVIENVVKNKLDENSLFAFCFIDLDNFKAFNDRYGYAKGNEVIKTMANISNETVASIGTVNDFVGHIGGDDFIILASIEKYADICQHIINEFDQKIIEFYNSEDLERGGIITKTRQREELLYPIMTVSIAVVLNDGRRSMNQIEISEIAAEIKKFTKTIPKSIFITDRRIEKNSKPNHLF